MVGRFGNGTNRRKGHRNQVGSGSSHSSKQAVEIANPANTSPIPERELLIELLEYRMPFGKYAGTRLLELPEAYLAWFARQGMPKGKLGVLMETALVVRSNGLTAVCQDLRRQLAQLR